MEWWVHDLYQRGEIVELISRLFWVILAITLHELAHGWAALWQGDDTPRRLERMTANPLVHMGPWSIVALLAIGIAWGVMPVNPSRFRSGRRGRVYVSGAGPAMNLALAAVTLTLLIPWVAFGPAGTDIHRNLAIFLFTGGWLNILLCVFNLLPIPPLDGSSILSGLSFRAYQFFQRPQSQLIGMFLILVIFITGCGRVVFAGFVLAAAIYVDLGSALLGGPPISDVLR
jgi:Zn-dependent protease